MRRVRFLVTLLFLLTLAGAVVGCAAEQEEDRSSAVRLETPGNLTLTGRELSWNVVLHAEGYVIEFLGERHPTKQNYYGLPELTGEVTVRVIACGDGFDYLDSEWAEYHYVNIVEEATAALKYTVLPDGIGLEVTRLYSDVNRGLEGRIYIPDYYNGMPVTRIADMAFCEDTLWVDLETGKGCNTVTTSVRLPKYLKEIGEDAFARCIALEEIEIPDSVETIGGAAFNRAISLKRIKLPAGLQRIERGTFLGTGIDELEIPETVTYIGRGAFSGCLNLSEVVIPDSVTEIDFQAFKYCEKLEAITMSKNIKKMGPEAFHDTAWYNAQPDGFVVLRGDILYSLKGDSIREVTALPEEVKYLAGGVFYYRQQLERVDLSSERGLTWIGDNYFYRCIMLKEVILPPDMTGLPEDMFSNCGRMELIVMPSSVKVIGKYAFDGTGSYARMTGTFRGLFYCGTQEEWEDIEIGIGNNDVLKNDLRYCYFYSETEPETNAEGTAYSGNYWRYVDGTPTAWTLV